jgi:hypothetical protein
VVDVQPSSGSSGSNSQTSWQPPNTLTPTTHQVLTDCCRKLACDCVTSKPVIGALGLFAGYMLHNAINSAFGSSSGSGGDHSSSGGNSSSTTTDYRSTTSTSTQVPWLGNSYHRNGYQPPGPMPWERR